MPTISVASGGSSLCSIATIAAPIIGATASKIVTRIALPCSPSSPMNEDERRAKDEFARKPHAQRLNASSRVRQTQLIADRQAATHSDNKFVTLKEALD